MLVTMGATKVEEQYLESSDAANALHAIRIIDILVQVIDLIERTGCKLEKLIPKGTDMRNGLTKRNIDLVAWCYQVQCEYNSTELFISSGELDVFDELLHDLFEDLTATYHGLTRLERTGGRLSMLARQALLLKVRMHLYRVTRNIKILHCTIVHHPSAAGLKTWESRSTKSLQTGQFVQAMSSWTAKIFNELLVETSSDTAS